MFDANKDSAFEHDDPAGAYEYAKVMAAEFTRAAVFPDRWLPGVLETEHGYHSVVAMPFTGGRIEVSLHPVDQVYIALVLKGMFSFKYVGDNQLTTLAALLAELQDDDYAPCS